MNLIKDIKTFKKQVKGALKKKEYQEAFRLIKEQVTLKHIDSWLLLKIADLKRLSNDNKIQEYLKIEVKELLTQSMEIDSENSDIFLELGYYYLLEENKSSKALSFLNEGINICETKLLALSIAKMETIMDLGETEKSIELKNELKRKFPASIERIEKAYLEYKLLA